MRAISDVTVTELIRMSGRPRNSAVLSLERLEKAGLVEHAKRGKWTVVDPDLFSRFLRPKPADGIGATCRAPARLAMRPTGVRHELTMA